MNWLKLTASSICVLGAAALLTSCEPNAEQKRTTDFEKKGIILSPAQEPQGLAVPSSALGTMDVFYSKETRTLSYSITWSGLTDSVMLMHMHGLAPRGYNAGVIQNIVTSSGGIYPQRTSGRYTFHRNGRLTGTLLADGVFVKEQDILNGMYYVNIHTSTNPSGEIRGQVIFQ